MERLKFGILCDETTLMKWQFRAIDEIISNGEADLKLIIVRDNKNGDRKKSKWNNWNDLKNGIFYRYRKTFCDFSEEERSDLLSRYGNIPRIKVDPVRKGNFSYIFNEKDISSIEEHEPDFLLRFGFGILKGRILEVPKYGIWSFHHDDEKIYRGGPPCYWEIKNENEVTGAILQKLTDKLDAGVILKKGYFNTIKDSYSKALDQSLYYSSFWPAEVSRQIVDGSFDLKKLKPSTTDARIYRIPGPMNLAHFSVKVLLRKFMNKVSALQREKWNIGYKRMRNEELLEEGSLNDVTWLKEKKGAGNFYADPFILMDEEGNHNILFEDYSYVEDRAKISMIRTVEGGSSNPRIETIIDSDEHLSYPFLIRNRKKTYLIPETCKSNRISYYEFGKFPYHLFDRRDLMSDIDAVDPTLVFHKDLWWLFFTRSSTGSTLNLHIFYSEDLKGVWKPHSMNPVKCDVRSSRPAGNPFVLNGKLYRPAQNCSKTYGGSVVINEVIELTETSFNEKKVIEHNGSGRYSKGLHTISTSGNMVVIDGRREETSVKFLIDSIKKKIN